VLVVDWMGQGPTEATCRAGGRLCCLGVWCERAVLVLEFTPHLKSAYSCLKPIIMLGNGILL
jgi:hypothetical protein